GISYHNTLLAIDRAIDLLSEYSFSNEVEEKVIYQNVDLKDIEVSLTLTKVNTYLSAQLTLEQVENVFKSLNFKYELTNETFNVHVPNYRNDIHIDVDLIEEIIRLVGYNNIISKLPTMQTTIGSHAPNEDSAIIIKQMLLGMGYNEAITYSLVNEKYINEGCMPIGEAVCLSNPLSDERKYYRTSLLNSLLESVSYNQSRFVENYALFEIGNVYDTNNNHQDRLSLAISPKINNCLWKKDVTNIDFYTVKGHIEQILTYFGFDSNRVFIKENDVDTLNYNPYQSAAIYIDRNLLGVFGLINPFKAKQLGINKCYIGELNLSTMFNSKPGKIKYQAISKYPNINFDLSMIVDEEINGSQILNAIRKYGKAIVKDVNIFDVYQGEHMEAGKKSIAVTIVFASNDKTLNDSDINPVLDNIYKGLQKEVNALIRDK
ncbi:MAG: phenylalanine--tRNA ligase subunit beta, partial [Erysipelotrichaceae bacterium]